MAKYKVKSILVSASIITKVIEANSETAAEVIAASLIKEKDWKPKRLLKTKIKEII